MSKSAILLKSGLLVAIATMGLGMTDHAKAMNLSIGVDLDPNAPGIQTLRSIDADTVDLNNGSISVDIVLTNDTDDEFSFTNVDLELLYNNRGLDVLADNSTPTSGNVVTSSFAIRDLVGGNVAFPALNAPLQTGATNAPQNGFARGTGRVAYQNIGNLFNVAAGDSEVLLSTSLDFNGIEGSTLLNTLGLLNGALAGPGQGGAINVTPGAVSPTIDFNASELIIASGPQGGGGPAVPEPTTLLGSGLVLLLGAFGRQRYRRAK